MYKISDKVTNIITKAIKTEKMELAAKGQTLAGLKNKVKPEYKR